MKKKKNIEKTLNRKSAVEQGFYDGRFMEKIVPDKKKKKSKSKMNKDDILKELDAGGISSDK